MPNMTTKSNGVTIVSPMRPFKGAIAEVQRNAIQSWLLSAPNSEILLIEDEESSTADEITDGRVRLLRTTKRSKLGAPLLDSMLREAAAMAAFNTIAYITADVLLPPNIETICHDLHKQFTTNQFFAICARYDITSQQEIVFDSENWFRGVQDVVRNHGQFHGTSAVDLWIYPKTLTIDSPPFPIGRCGTDNWVIWKMKQLGVPVVDVTPNCMIVHQWHPKYASKSPLFYEEQLECVSLWPAMPYDAMSCIDADYLLVDSCLKRPSVLRRLHMHNRQNALYRFMIGQYRKLRKPELYSPKRAREV